MGGEWFDFAKNADQFANSMSIGRIPLIVLTAAPQPPNHQSPLPREWQIAIEPVDISNCNVNSLTFQRTAST